MNPRKTASTILMWALQPVSPKDDWPIFVAAVILGATLGWVVVTMVT